MNVSCPQHPRKPLRPERADENSLLYRCGNHYALMVIYPLEGSRRATPDQQAHVDALNERVKLA